MKWRNALVVLSLAVMGASIWACGDDPATTPSATNKPTGNCPDDDPMTEIDESECKDLATAEAGGTAIMKRGCKTCHGDDMAGADKPLDSKDEYKKTPLGDDVMLYPPNLTADDATGVGKWNDDALALAIRTGVDNTSQQLCPQMQHFSKMSDFEVYSIVKYLRGIPKVTKKVPRSVCPPTKTKEQQQL